METRHICENCNKKWVALKLPTKRDYKAQRVYVKKVSILISEEIMRLRAKKGMIDFGRIFFIENADFCCLQCFLDYIDKFMKGKILGKTSR